MEFELEIKDCGMVLKGPQPPDVSLGQGWRKKGWVRALLSRRSFEGKTALGWRDGRGPS